MQTISDLVSEVGLPSNAKPPKDLSSWANGPPPWTLGPSLKECLTERKMLKDGHSSKPSWRYSSLTRGDIGFGLTRKVKVGTLAGRRPMRVRQRSCLGGLEAGSLKGRHRVISRIKSCRTGTVSQISPPSCQIAKSADGTFF